MKRGDRLYTAYCRILEQELLPATGCTEPIALALCAAKARRALGALPEKIVIEVSGNILKNAKCVTVPNTNGMKGIEAAVCAGVVAGREERALDVLAGLTETQIGQITAYHARTPIRLALLDASELLDMIVTVFAGEHRACVRLNKHHTHIHSIFRDDQCLYLDKTEDGAGETVDYGLLTVRDIYEFAQCVEIRDIRPVIERQIRENTAIAEEGMRHAWGANVGKTILKNHPDSIKERACAYAAAGSDARMSGCDLPVVINSGSGNQGLTVSLPVLVYAQAHRCDQDTLYRALALSNLCAVHIKDAIGRLSAFCGAVTAGSAAGAGIAYLLTGDFSTVAHTIVNSLAIVSGMICDGAKPSCAAKIAASVQAGIMGLELYMNEQQFYAGEGIISKGIEKTIQNIGLLGREGMRETDRKILEILTAGQEQGK
ncbi:MAG: serine dehydratase subunit alpha family protein [Clostridia bacterium]|nr:serine dehydratase subunit alpha family protein [Clostridia bacterium]